ncbi:polysaccharide pyruvyl transferase family protein [uncultured Psychrobacter sp.]|uniref:polysaccharide pyruvyl transferase family protein n=1 Tax=uncultured Psychrobacter sp. TaxID=259303 RepID=UPI002596537B|nr:polysaccharide pyruvyl transferase family protein [uncultured Psychrobacter sp.]
MKYIKSPSKVLKRNSSVKSTIKSIIPKNIITKVNNSLNKDNSIRLYFNNDTALIDTKNKSIQGVIPVFYWDSKPNFGDFIGPYLISKITGKPVLNVRNTKGSGIMAVGSILQMLDRENMVIWGSGLIKEPNNQVIKKFRKYKPKVLSVRGKETARFLSEAGIKVQDQSAYGDPALTLPLFYEPSVSSEKKIGICPHHIHKNYFLENIVHNNNLKTIDVQRDVESVVDEITSSSVCISTSLHGLIIAQAYNIPWVWLEITDNNLIGNDFKFDDFFSTINKSQVSHIKVKMAEVESLDFELISRKASLPDKMYNEKLILRVIKEYLQE